MLKQKSSYNFPTFSRQIHITIKYSANGGSSYNGGEINFGVDDINVDPSIDSNYGIISEVGSYSTNFGCLCL